MTPPARHPCHTARICPRLAVPWTRSGDMSMTWTYPGLAAIGWGPRGTANGYERPPTHRRESGVPRPPLPPPAVLGHGTETGSGRLAAHAENAGRPTGTLGEEQAEAARLDAAIAARLRGVGYGA